MKTFHLTHFYIFLVYFFLVLDIKASIINVPSDQATIQEAINAAIKGDTILVAPGIYYENINFSGKNILLGSYFILSEDTTYISQTIIDGNNDGTVVTFASGEDSTSVLCGFTVRNGNKDSGAGGGIFIVESHPYLKNVIVTQNSAGNGGGILINYYSNPLLTNVTISGNISKLEGISGHSVGGGGLLIIANSNPILENVLIENNIAQRGAGIRCDDSSNPQIIHSIIRKNRAKYYGGGFYVRGGQPVLENVTIEGNQSDLHAAGIYCYESNLLLDNVNIKKNIANNDGGGLYTINSDIDLQNVTIHENIAGNNHYDYGGGIYCENSKLSFSKDNLCNIYLNKAAYGNDIYSETTMHILVDSFTVLQPTKYHLYPFNNFTFDFQAGRFKQVTGDLYVSPTGDNSYSGISINNPLQTIDHAQSIMYADSLSPGIIHLANGTYNPSSNKERLPLYGLDYISISGAEKNTTIIDAQDSSDVLRFNNCEGSHVKNVTITGGNLFNIYIKNSNLKISDAKIIECQKYGINARDSYLTLNNVYVADNHDEGIILHNSEGIVENSIIKRNNSGIISNKSNLKISKTEISENKHSGLSFQSNSLLNITNAIIVKNQTRGIQISDSKGRLTNVLIKENFGGGLSCHRSVIALGNVKIAMNQTTNSGGGIYLADSSIVNFDPQNLCNIYLNKAGIGRDLFNKNSPLQEVYLDTFTVKLPNGYFAAPINKFNFTIQTGKIAQIQEDLYVSPNGDDNNEGISHNHPLRTIDMAYTKIIADSLNPRNIYLSKGIYSKTNNNEFFPINCRSYTTLKGDENEYAILDAKGKSRVMNCYYTDGVNIQNVILKNGYSSFGAGVNSTHSNPGFANVCIQKNNGIGLYCNYSNPKLYKTVISDNYSSNSFEDNAGGIHCYHSNPLLNQVTMTKNGSTYFYGNWFASSFYFSNSNPIFINNIIWDNAVNDLQFISDAETQSVTISHSTIQGGDSSIVTIGDVQINWLHGNLNSNPFFKDVTNTNYSLSKNSPCIDAGTALLIWQGDTITNLSDSLYLGLAPDMGALEFDSLTTVEADYHISLKFDLNQNYPNPFNYSTVITYNIPRYLQVNLSIFNILGQKVYTLINSHQKAGFHKITWNAIRFPSGIYYYKLTTGKFSQIKKSLLIK